MIPTTNLHDPLDEEAAELDPRLVADLRADYRQPTRLDVVDLAIRRAAEARGPGAALPQRSRRRLRLHPRLSAPIAVLAVLVAAGGAYLQAQSPARVSAQTILRRAEAAGLVPSQVTHYVYQITSSTGYSSAIQFWEQAETGGVGVRGWVSQSAATPPPLIPTPNDMYRRNSSLPIGSSFKGQEKLDGVTVDVIQLPAIQSSRLSTGSIQGVDRLTVYIDAQSYITRGWDWVMTGGPLAGSTWHMRLVHYETLPASAAPWHGHGRPATSGSARSRKG